MTNNQEFPFVVFSFRADGTRDYYTGRAGSGWIAPGKPGAFGFDTYEAAQRKADLFNEATCLHGRRFLAEMICR